MTQYEELGKTAEELTALGRELVNKVMFRNEPYDHYVFVVGDELEFAAIAHYTEAYLNTAGMVKNYDRYKQVSGLTINWTSRNTVYSVVALHVTELKYFNATALTEFIKTTIHEQQHMLTRIERYTGADHRFEDEPRTYSTGWTYGKIVEILQKNWNIYQVAMPDWMIPRTRTLNYACNALGVRVSANTIYCGVMHQHMMANTGTVRHRNEDWSATTYLSGGEHV